MPQGHSIDEFDNMMDEDFDWDEWSEEDKRNHGY